MGKTGPVRAGSVRWARNIAASDTPVFLLDAKRRVLLFNQGCIQCTGWTADELLGRSCDYVTVADSHSREALLAACAPPAEVWRGQLAEVPVNLPHRSNAARTVRIRFQPLLSADQRVLQVLGTILPVETLSSTVATPAQALHAELSALRQQVRSRYGEDAVIAQSLPMRRVLSQMAIAGKNAGGIVFTGERGTGREHLARAVHARGPLGKRAFVPVNCRHTESSELKRILKHLKDDARGYEALQTGTLFLEEISAAPRDVQERLAEWLSTNQTADAPRIMASTDQPLQELMVQDAFHRELYFLLTTFVIEVPPLRQRMEDLLPLAQFFLEEENHDAEKQVTGFSPDAMDALRRYHWPGNVTELQETVHFAAVRAREPLITPEQFPLSFRAGQDAQRLGPAPAPQIMPLEHVLEHAEREQIQAALAACRNNLTKAAELLGLSRPKLYRRLEALGLLPGDAPGAPVRGESDDTASPAGETTN